MSNLCNTCPRKIDNRNKTGFCLGCYLKSPLASLRMKGKVPWNRGKKATIKEILNLRAGYKKWWEEKGYKEHHPMLGKKAWNKGIETPIDTRIKQSLSKTKKSFFEGFSRETERARITSRIRASSKYSKWRKEVLERDNYICQRCFSTDNLEVDHCNIELRILISMFNIISIKQANKIPEMWDINNGKTLCKNCHILKHPKVIAHLLNKYIKQ